MNIFVLNLDPKKAAWAHNDKHCVKMILESAQMLCTAHRILDPLGCDPKVYKAVFVNHPCTIWTRTNNKNYLWLFDLFKELMAEYKRRYKRDHKCNELIPFLKKSPKNILKTSSISPFAQAMPDEYRNVNAVKAYRDYYVGEKAKISTWKHSSVPIWYKKMLNIRPKKK